MRRRIRRLRRVQPDHQLRIPEELGGQSRGRVGGYHRRPAGIGRRGRPSRAGRRTSGRRRPTTSGPASANTSSSARPRRGPLVRPARAAASSTWSPAPTASSVPKSSPASGSTRPALFAEDMERVYRGPGPGPGHARACGVRCTAGGEGPAMSTVDRPGRKVLPPLVEGQELDRETVPRTLRGHAAATRGPNLSGGSSPWPRRCFTTMGARTMTVGELARSTIGWQRLEWRALRMLRRRMGEYGRGPARSPAPHPADELGGRSRVVGGFVVGPPELVVEVADSSRLIDLDAKKAAIRAAWRFGIPVLRRRSGGDPLVHASATGDSRRSSPGLTGSCDRESSPGLWLDPTALIARDLRAFDRRAGSGPGHARARRVRGPLAGFASR